MTVGRCFRFDFDAKTVRIDNEVHQLESMDRSDYADQHTRRARLKVGDFLFSMIWGNGTYSDNYDAECAGQPFNDEPYTVEVMTMKGDVGDGADEPRGWQSPTDVLNLIALASNPQPTDGSDA